MGSNPTLSATPLDRARYSSRMAGDTYWARLQRRRVSRRRFLAGSGMAAAGSVALLAGCGGDAPAPVATQPPTATRPSATPTPTATATPTPTPSPTPTAIPTPDPDPPRRGGTLRLWKWEPDAGLDPGIYHLNNRDIIYSTLTQALTYQPTKNLFAMDGMTGYEQVDPVTLVWSVRPGMRFHNGDPVDAEAVAFSFGRLGKLYDALGGTHVWRAGFDFVHSFEATDELALTEHWSRPNADALVYRARHYYSFLNPRIVEAHGAFEGTYIAPDGTTEDMFSIQDLPFGVGSGPYTLAKRDENGARVERWPDYHKHKPADDGFVEDGPYIDAWETRIFPTSEAAKSAFLSGELDVHPRMDHPQISAEELPEFKGVDRVSVAEIPNGGYSMLGMDGAKFHDKRSRQALQKAFDYEGFIEALRPLGGKYTAPISDLLPHFQRLSQEDLKQWYRYDPKEARALWDAANFEIPVEQIRIWLATLTTVNWRIAEFAARSLHESLGVEGEPYSTDGHVLRPPSGEPKQYELLSYGSGTGGGTLGIPGYSHLIHYDPRKYGFTAFNFFAESPEPEIAEDSRTLNAMLEAQEREMDFDARVERLTEIQRWILDRHWCNWALPVNQSQHYGFSSRLRDHAPDDWPNSYGLRRESMWLADA